MFGEQDISDMLDDVHWKNVQDPIKQMFLALSKAIRVQSAGIRELDKKCMSFITKDNAKYLVQENFQQACNKQDATHIIYELDKKVNEKDYFQLETKVTQLTNQIHDLETHLHEQNQQINAQQSHIQVLEQEITLLKQPNYDPIFNYLDRQLMNQNNDITRQLATKANAKDIETMLPIKIEENYRLLTSKYQDLLLDIKYCVKKEELIQLLQSKVDNKDYQELINQIPEKLSRYELQTQLNQQIKPLLLSITAIEKTIQTQETQTQQKLTLLQQDYQQTIHKFTNIQQTLEEYVHNPLLIKQTNLIQYIQEQIDLSFHSFENQHKSQETMNSNNLMDYLLKQINIATESNRLEIISNIRSEFSVTTQDIQSKIILLDTFLKEVSNKHAKTRHSLKELSTNIIKSLAKKVDIKEFQQFIQQQDSFQRLSYQSKSINQSHPASSPSESSNDDMISPILSENEPLPSSHRLFPTPLTTSNMFIDAKEQELAYEMKQINNEYDGLIQSLKQDHRRNRQKKTSFVDSGSDSLEDKPIASASFRTKSPSSTSFAHKNSSSTKLNKSILSNKSIRSQSASPQRLGKPTTPTSSGLYDQISRLNQQLQELHSLIAARQTHPSSSSSAPGTPRNQSPSRQNTTNNISFAGLINAANDRLDWRMALGEVCMNLRHELSDKCSREELLNMIRFETKTIDERFKDIQQTNQTFVDKTMVKTIEQEIQALKGRVASELTGARFLWTTGDLKEGGFIPWDTQVINASPNVIQWKKQDVHINVRVPGLYFLSVAIFTTEAIALQVYLNDEPIFVYTPNQTLVTTTKSLPSQGSASALIPQRLRHSIGEVSSIALNEFVSLPPDAKIAVRYQANVPAQGFLSLRKL